MVTLRRAVLATASALVLSVGSVFAQDAAPQSDKVEKVVVTGSRIQKPGLNSPNPITSVSSDSIQFSGEINITDVLDRYPALLGSLDPASTTNVGAVGIAGLNQLNLRNLGTNRTLVLVNGRRHVGSLAGDTGVDVNSIPMDLVERVDILTGGVSAIYGADAVTGVVNFIMRRKLDGIVGRVQASGAEQGDLGRFFGSVAAGTSFDEERGNLMVAFEHHRGEELDPGNRDVSNENAFFLVRNVLERAACAPGGIPPRPLPHCGDGQGDVAGRPDRIFARGVGWPDSAPSGVITGLEWLFQGFDLVEMAKLQTAGLTDPSIPKQAYLGTGQLWDPGIHVGNRQIGGNTTKLHTYNGFLLPEENVLSLNLIGDYELSRRMRLFGEAKYVANKSLTSFQPSFDFGVPIRTTNPLIPASILTNLTPISGAILGTADDFYFTTRDNFDLGVRRDNTKRETYRTVLGIDGEIAQDLLYELSYVFGRTDVTQRDLNNRITDRFFAAIDVAFDANGRLVCRSDLFPNDPLPDVFNGGSLPHGISFTPGPNSGCVPINIMDPNPKSEAALRWINTVSITESRLDQTVLSGFFSYDTSSWFSLQGGGIGLVVGGEWRREESQNNPDPILLTGNTFGNVLQPSGGAYEVRESFAEIDFPILKDVTLAHELSVGGAIRSSQYTSAGDTLSWKYGGIWAPTADIRFRSTASRAVRAPNIGELFGPEQQSFFQPNDPCDQSRVNQGSSTRLANCIAALSALGVPTVPYTFDGNLTSSFPGISTGNPNLQEETADTVTLGAVVTPTFIKNLSIFVDYWTVEIQNAILLPLSQDIVNACYDAPSLVNPFCAATSRVTPAEVTPNATLGQLDGLIRQQFNIASFESAGIDFEMNYQFDIADVLGPDMEYGSLRVSVVGSKLEQLDLVTLPGAQPEDDVGQSISLLGGASPEWTLNFGLQWNYQEWTVGYAYRWFSETDLFEKVSLANDPDQASVTKLKALNVHDLVVRYQATESIELYGGVRNLLDEEPDIGQTVLPIGPEGRQYNIGVRVSVDSAFK